MNDDHSDGPLGDDPVESGPEDPEAGEQSKPIRGGRRLGDDPFLADEGFFWWLPRSFSLLVVAVALMLLGAHFFGGDEEGDPPQPAARSTPTVPDSPASVPASQPATALQHVTSAPPNRLDRARSYNARRRMLLQEAELLMTTLPPEGTGNPEEDRDRRVLRDFVRRMDTPAR